MIFFLKQLRINRPKVPLKRDMCLAWSVAAMVGAMLPLVLAGTVREFPQLRLLPCFSFCPLPLCPGFEGLYRTLTISAAAVYWGGGLLAGLRHKRVAVSLRECGSGFFFLLGISLYLFSFPLLSAVWSIAMFCGYCPDGPWGVNDGSHGHWHFIRPLKDILFPALFLPIPAASALMYALALKPDRYTVGALLLCLAGFWVMLYAHGWLVD